MTNDQKEKIAELRAAGFGYANIASALGLTKNQVVSYCHRNGLTGEKATKRLPVGWTWGSAGTAGSPSCRCPEGSRSSSAPTIAARAGGTNIRRPSTGKQSTPSPAPAVGSPSRPTGTGTGSTARMPATSQDASEVMAVNEDQFEREKLYQATMSMFQAMMKDGLITEEQYAKIDTKMREKYQPIIGTLFPENT